MVVFHMAEKAVSMNLVNSNFLDIANANESLKRTSKDQIE